MGFVIALAAVIGLGTGIVVGLVFGYKRPVGDLRVDRSDPTNPPYLFLELDTDVYAIMRKKHVIFRVKCEDFVPHE